jgi:hypothetical protein
LENTLRHQHFSFGHLFLTALRYPRPRVMAELEGKQQQKNNLTLNSHINLVVLNKTAKLSLSYNIMLIVKNIN